MEVTVRQNSTMPEFIIVFVVKMKMVMYGLENIVKFLRQTFVRMIRNGIFLEGGGFVPTVVLVKMMLGTFQWMFFLLVVPLSLVFSILNLFC
jgi:hypothetical protein